MELTIVANGRQSSTMPCPGCGTHQDMRIVSTSKELDGSGADIEIWCLCGATSRLRLDLAEGLPFLSIQAVALKQD